MRIDWEVFNDRFNLGDLSRRGLIFLALSLEILYFDLSLLGLFCDVVKVIFLLWVALFFESHGGKQDAED
jgi:hypothetical protein